MAREMKDSGVEWIGEIPIDWTVYPLRHRFSFGKGLPITKDNLKNQGVPVISYGQIHSKVNTGTGIIPPLVRYVDESYLQGHPDSLVNQDDFIFADTSEDKEGCGNCVYVDSQGTLFAGYHTIILRNKEKDNNHYLSFLFKTDTWRKQIRERVTGVKLFSISQKILKETSIILPPEEEQCRIASYLTTQCARIDAVIEKTRASIEEYKNLKQAVITQAVTKGIRPGREMKDSGVEWIGEIPECYSVQRIKHLGSYRNGLTYTPENIVDEEQGTLVLRSSNVQQGKLYFDDNVYVNSYIPERLMVQKGDIIICSRNGSRELIGKCAIVEDNITASFGAFMMIFRGNSPKYMYYILNSDVFKYYLSSFLTSTINQLTGSNFGNMEIVWCSDKSEQDEIVEYLDKKTTEIDILISQKHTLLVELEGYKKSISFEYVTGKKEVVL